MRELGIVGNEAFLFLRNFFVPCFFLSMPFDDDHMSGEDSPLQEECGSYEQARDSNEPACRFETFWVYKTLIKSVLISSDNFSSIIFYFNSETYTKNIPPKA